MPDSRAEGKPQDCHRAGQGSRERRVWPPSGESQEQKLQGPEGSRDFF